MQLQEARRDEAIQTFATAVRLLSQRDDVTLQARYRDEIEAETSILEIVTLALAKIQRRPPAPLQKPYRR